jgi:hypothetical protein
VKQIRGIKTKIVVLQMAILALLFYAVPVNAQNSDATTTSTTGPLINQNDPLLKGSDLGKTQDTYAGMGQDINVRKDAWTWYWNEKAHLDIDSQNTKGFWGNDVVSVFFKGIADNFVVPFWNGAMEYDFVRAGLLLIIAGMLIGLGASFVLPKKPESK